MVLERGLLHQLASPVLKGFFGVQALGLTYLPKITQLEILKPYTLYPKLRIF